MEEWGHTTPEQWAEAKRKAVWEALIETMMERNKEALDILKDK